MLELNKLYTKHNWSESIVLLLQHLHRQQQAKGSPFLKCVVSIYKQWALPVRGGGCKGLPGWLRALLFPNLPRGVSVRACQDGLGYPALQNSYRTLAFNSFIRKHFHFSNFCRISEQTLCCTTSGLEALCSHKGLQQKKRQNASGVVFRVHLSIRHMFLSWPWSGAGPSLASSWGRSWAGKFFVNLGLKFGCNSIGWYNMVV